MKRTFSYCFGLNYNDTILWFPRITTVHYTIFFFIARKRLRVPRVIVKHHGGVIISIVKKTITTIDMRTKRKYLKF